MLELPDFDALYDEQEEVLDIPIGKSAIVIGPPGTGKTVMAIYRARMMQKAGHKTVLIMYNKLLSQYTAAAVRKAEIDGTVATFHGWFPRFWSTHFNAPAPKVSDWDYDWDAIFKMLVAKKDLKKDLHILVDEGQDMPNGFYLVMATLAKSLTVFADENQRITENQSTIEDIKTYTQIKDVRLLTRNYRNTRPIAMLAKHFYTGLPSGIPALPPATKRGDKPALSSYENLFKGLTAVTTYERNYPTHAIGVLVPYKRQVFTMVRRLEGKTRNQVQGYVSVKPGDPKPPPIDFGSPGVKVVTYASAKGLEFHAVFLPELQTLRGDPDGDDLKMKFYVLTSRARRVLNLGYSGTGSPGLVESLPMSLLEDRR
jgi:DNA helicase IV